MIERVELARTRRGYTRCWTVQGDKFGQPVRFTIYAETVRMITDAGYDTREWHNPAAVSVNIPVTLAWNDTRKLIEVKEVTPLDDDDDYHDHPMNDVIRAEYEFGHGDA